MAKFSGGESVQLIGARQLRRELRALDSGLPKRLRLILKGLADDFVPELKAAARSHSRQMAKGARSIRSGATARRSYIAFGGKSAPWMAGAEFGSDRYKQFLPWRGNGSNAGYALFPMIRRAKTRTRKEAIRRLDDFIESVLP